MGRRWDNWFHGFGVASRTPIPPPVSLSRKRIPAPSKADWIRIRGSKRCRRALLAQRGISMEVWLPNSLPLILGLVAQLAIVRLLLEVAAIIISTSRTSK